MLSISLKSDEWELIGVDIRPWSLPRYLFPLESCPLSHIPISWCHPIPPLADETLTISQANTHYLALNDTIMSAIWLPPAIGDSSHDIGGTSSGSYILPSILRHDQSVAPHKRLQKWRTSRWSLRPLIVPHSYNCLNPALMTPSPIYSRSKRALPTQIYEFIQVDTITKTCYCCNYPNCSDMEHFHKAGVRYCISYF